MNFQPFMKFFQQNFLIHEPQFSCADCKSVDRQHLRDKLPTVQGTLFKRDTLEVGNVSLTGVSSRGRQCDSAF